MRPFALKVRDAQGLGFLITLSPCRAVRSWPAAHHSRRTHSVAGDRSTSPTMTTPGAAATDILGSYHWPVHHQYQPVESDRDEELRSVSPLSTSTRSMVSGSESPRTPTPTTLPAARELTASALQWTPPYLRRTVIASFVLVFALILVAIEVLLAFSNKHDGIATGYAGQQYLWTYGPTVVLTLVAAIWSRVEYQAKLVAPWVRLSQQPAPADRTILLDYLSDFLPYSVVKAAKNRDYLVSAASAVAILVKTLIIISTGLITLSWTPVKMESYPMTLQDRFVNDASRLGANALPFYMMTGTAENNLSYPDGIYQSYAFQSMHSDLPGDAETRVIADGFESSLDCQPANLNLTWARPLDPHYSDSRMNFTVTSEGCHASNVSLSPPMWCGGNSSSCTKVFGRFARIQCGNVREKNQTRDSGSDIGEMLLLVIGNLTWTVDFSRNKSDYTGTEIIHPYLFKLNKSAQMVCTPGYSLRKIEVVRNGTKTLSTTPVRHDQNPTILDSVSSWDIMKAHDQSHSSSGEHLGGVTNSVSSLSLNVSGTIMDVDQYIRLALLSQSATRIPVASLFDPGLFRNLFTNYYQQITAIIVKQALMEPASIPVTGSAVVFGNRLLIRDWAAQLMAGLVAACILFSVVIFFIAPSKNKHSGMGMLPRSPSTLFGMAAILQNSASLLRRLHFAGAADDKALRGLLGNSKYLSAVRNDSASSSSPERVRFTILDEQSESDEPTGTTTGPSLPQVKSLRARPGIVYPVTRVGLGAFLLGLIVVLELLLQKSMGENGLGDVGDDTHLHYTWTTIPAVVLGALAIMFSAMDFRTRALAPYTAMKRGVVGAEVFMGLEFLDSSIPRAVYREVKLGNFGALTATLALFIASVLTVFSASLFHPAFVEISGPVSLSINESFSAKPDVFAVQYDPSPFLTAGLILESNMSFPKFTYGDLAFPTFKLVSEISMPGGDGPGGYDPRTLPIHAVVPAVRSRLLCRSYYLSQMQLNWTTNASAPPSIKYPNTLGVWIAGEEECIPANQKNSSNHNAKLEVASPNATYFSLSSQTSFDSDVRGCSGQLYVWGKVDSQASPSVIQHIAAMGCNVTYEALEVDVTFRNADLEFDPDHPPVPREDTVRITTTNSVANFSKSYMYDLLPELNTAPDPLDKFFAALTTSRWAVPRSSLGDPSAHKTVTDSIRFHDSIIQAQLLAYARVPANETNATIAEPKPDQTDDKLRFNGTATNSQARRRVQQDPVSTRILEALLSTLVVLLFLGWVFARDAAMLASSPTTIASRAAVIAGGNLLKALPEDAAYCSEKEIAVALGGERARIRIGWDRGGDEGDGGYKAEAGEARRFGIFVSRGETQR